MKPIRMVEGDWFAVPLRQGGFALGVVARKGRRGVLYGYFYGPRLERVPDLAMGAGKSPENALRMMHFGDASLRTGDWPKLGSLPSWRRGDWPILVCGRFHEISGTAFRVIYGERPNRPLAEERCSLAEAKSLPRDTLYDAGAVEIILTRLLEQR